MESKKTVKRLLLLFHCGILFRCGSPVVNNTVPIAKQENFQSKPYLNPALINGSSFGHYLQSLYRFGRCEDLIKFSSSGSVHKFGHTQLLNYYKSKMKFDFELGKLSNITSNADTFVLIYTRAHIDATRRLIRIKVVIENDSCKLILPNLNPNPFY
ncbi:hypothetical protein [Aurantibacillus circumpalustris]|uniref:hypothetical protein n=1 Tax=Aurantibacillus circumpalustris TaxID=3036359 RepID=UPI00295B81AF|nr:hypothetical protein [Aurantibacillus circumpalustris]